MTTGITQQLSQQIADERLRMDSVSAKSAAIQAVEESLTLEDEEDDILNSGFVQLNIGDQSPMVRDGKGKRAQ